jgi:hypothetical protein
MAFHELLWRQKPRLVWQYVVNANGVKKQHMRCAEDWTAST